MFAYLSVIVSTCCRLVDRESRANKMADTAVQGMSVNHRKYGIFHWGLVVSALLILTVVIVVALVLLLDDENTTVLLVVLILALIIVGVVACMFLQWLHRRALRRRDEGAKDWIHRTLSANHLHVAAEPTPPPAEPSAPSLSPRHSWIHWAPWRKSTSTSGPPSYRAVSSNGSAS
ncbi:hypothetical protein L9F63_021864 [Diploptera punctata]|uniref:Uncharacterized protein n=1 Tax=Diploptera punctata TaxID=6984 RepID=A0AAD7ZN09_DIPPU|nr:hypothetical protein L9F63_021864 [Diploptera punctata]